MNNKEQHSNKKKICSESMVIVKEQALARREQIDKAPKKQRLVLRQPSPLQRYMRRKKRKYRDSFW